jgi:hypothetical protein
MRIPALALLPIVLAGLAIASCSTSGSPRDQFNLEVRDPTAAVEAQADPNAEPGVTSPNAIVPQP